MTSRKDLKNAFERLSRVREELFELTLDDPITILDKHGSGVLFEIYSVEDLNDLETGTTLYYEGVVYTLTARGGWATTYRGEIDNYCLFKILLFKGQFKCVYDPGVGE